MNKLQVTSRLRLISAISFVRPLSTSSCLCGRKSRIPWDRRFAPRTTDVGPTKEGGSEKLVRILGRGEDMPQPPGYLDSKGRFHVVPEMIPEFVVPDLTDFKLKPYVSYKVSDVTQSEFTAKDLFNTCYARNIVEEYKNGKLSDQDLDSLVEKTKAEGSVMKKEDSS